MRDEDVLSRAPTARAGLPTRWQEREAWGRRAGIGVLVLVLVAAAGGILGPGTGTTTTGADDLSVVHPTLTRPGLDVQLDVAIRPRADTEQHRLLVDREAFDAFGLETVRPEPVSMTSRGDDIELEFEGDADREVRVTLSGRVPADQGVGPVDWTVARAVGEGTSTVRARTWVLP